MCDVCSERFVVNPEVLLYYVVVAGWGGGEIPDDPAIHRLHSHGCGEDHIVVVDQNGHTQPLIEAAVPSGLAPDPSVSSD